MTGTVSDCSSSEDGAGPRWVSSAGGQGADGLGTDRLVTGGPEAGGLVADRVQMDGPQTDDTDRQDSKLRVLTERVAALSAELTVQGAELSAATTSVARVREALQCSVCLEPFAQAHTLQCGHTFCLACLQQWLPGHRQCPTCRALVTQRPIAAYAVQDAVRSLGLHTDEPDTDADTDDAWARMFRAPGRRSWSPSASPPLSLFEAGELDEPFAHGTARSTEHWMRTLVSMSETESELESSLVHDGLRTNASRPYTLMREVQEQQHNERLRQVDASIREPLQLIADMRSRVAQMRASNEQQSTSHSSAYVSRLDPASTSGGSVRVAPYLQAPNTSRGQDPAVPRVETPLIQDSTELLLQRARSQLREQRAGRVERERALLEQRRAESEQWRRDYEQRRQAREQRDQEMAQERAQARARDMARERALERARETLEERLQESAQRRIALYEQVGLAAPRRGSETRSHTDIGLARSLRQQIAELRTQVQNRAIALGTGSESPSNLLQQIGNIRTQVQQLRTMSGSAATLSVYFDQSVNAIAEELQEPQPSLVARGFEIDLEGRSVLDHLEYTTAREARSWQHSHEEPQPSSAARGFEIDFEDRSVLDHLEYTVASEAPSQQINEDVRNEHMWESMSDVDPLSDIDDPVSAIHRRITGMREQLQLQLSTSSVDVYQTEDQGLEDQELEDQEMDDHEWQQRRVARRREILENMLSGQDASGVELSAWIRRRLDIPELNPSSPEYDPVTQTRVLTEYFQRTQPSSQSADRIRLQRRRQP
ncbi:E3 ubiquitin ligase [Coemansia sp. RSA 720]|nr:E3 ubiquitin ligase [Coemansia sp. RSA 720]